MSKILLIKAAREDLFGGSHYSYPDVYDREKIRVVCYEHVGEEKKIKARFKKSKINYGHEYLIGIVADEDADQFLANSDIRELDPKEAIEKGLRWRPQVVKSNQHRALELLSKSARGLDLTISEKDELDPDIPGGAMFKSKRFDHLLDETKEEVDRKSQH